MAAGSGDRHTSERAAQQCDWLVSTQPIAQAPAGAGPGWCWAPRAARSCPAWGEREGRVGSCTRRPLSVTPGASPGQGAEAQGWVSPRRPQSGPRGAERRKGKWLLWGHGCFWTHVRVAPRLARPQLKVSSPKCVYYTPPPEHRRSAVSSACASLSRRREVGRASAPR